MFNPFTNISSNAHHVCCEYSPTKGLHDHCQSDDLDLHSRSQVHLKLDYLLTYNILDINRYLSYITLKLGMTVVLWMPYVLMLVLMTLTQVHSGSAKANNHRCMLSVSNKH